MEATNEKLELKVSISSFESPIQAKYEIRQAKPAIMRRKIYKGVNLLALFMLLISKLKIIR